MTVNFHPGMLLATAVFVVAFGSVLSMAIDTKQGVAVGVLGLLAYLLVEVLITFNPVVWWREQRNRQRVRS